MINTNGKPQGRQRQLLESATGTALDGWGIDADEHLYRPLTGKRGENLPSYQHEKMLGIAKYLYRSNPVAQRYITLYSDFVLGEGVALSFRNSQVADIISEHWDHPYNNWDTAIFDLYESFLLTGELLIPLFDDRGTMTIGSELVDNIKSVESAKQNWRIIERVKMRSDTGTDDGIVYTVVNRRVDRSVLSDEHPALYYSRMNPFGTRGMSLLYPVADFLDLLDQFAFSEVERWMLLKAFVWDVTIDGADEDQIAEYRKSAEYATPPKPGEVRIHNQNVTWQALAPRLDAIESSNAMRFIRNHIGGGLGIPEHWYAEGGDVNRAVGAVMAEPVRKRMSRLQDEFKFVITDVLKAQLDYAIEEGRIQEEVLKEDSEGNPTDEMISVYEAFDVNMPEVSSADTNDLAMAFQQVVSSVATAKDEGLISEETAQKAVALIVQQLGVEMDLTEERDRIAADREQRERDRPDMPQGNRQPVQLQQMMSRDREAGS